MSYKSSLFTWCRKLFTAARGLLLRPARQSNNELQYRSALLSIFTNIAAFLALLVFIAAFLGETNKIASALQAATFFAISLLVFYINRKGHYRPAAIIFIISIWLGATFTILVSGGMHSSYNFLFMVLILLSGLLLEAREVWWVIAFVTMTGLAIVFLEGLIPVPILFLGPPLAVWIILTILIILVTLAIQFTQQRAREAFSQSIRELEMRRSTERNLVIQNRLMQDINKLGIELAALPSDTNLHIFLVKKLKQLSGAAVVTMGEYLPEMKAIHMRHIEVDNSILETLNDHIDPDILSFVSKLNSLVSPVPDDICAMILAEGAGYRENLTETSLGTIPIEVSDKIRKIFDINYYAGIAYSFEGTLYGSSILAYKRDQQKPPEELLHAFAALAAVSLRRKHAEHALEKTMAELKRSNEELQQFAYVASHDLQEPLRMVSSYMQLLEKRYADKLDPDAHDFIGYAVSGARRMQNLISNLLAYSRVGTRAKPFKSTDCADVFNAAVCNLEVAIKENGAVVTHGSLPRINADEGQLVQVFQNLLGNAIKFHGQETPRIDVGAERKNGNWVFRVKDNGIGIDPKFNERIFVIFQRLHSDEYPGSGMGLAITKKIVQRHGGQIWVESAPGQGSTFYFTIPADD